MIEIFEKVLNLLENAEATVNMFVMKKTYSKFKDKLYKLYTVEITNKVATEFINIAKNQLLTTKQSLENNECKIRNFFDLELDSQDISFIDVKQIETFESVINQIKQFTRLETIESFEKIKRIHAYAIEVKTLNKSFLYFRKYQESKIITKKFITFLFYKGKFDEIKGDILIFDNLIDCFYLDETKKMYILNRVNFEQIFDFKEYYRKQTIDALKTLEESNSFEISQELANSIPTKYKIARKITKLHKSGTLKISVEVLKKHKEKIPHLRYTIEKEKIIINDEKALEDFLNVCYDNYVEGIVSGEKYIAKSKEKLQVK